MIGLIIFAAAQAQAPSAPAAAPAVKVADADKIVCRRFVETGSLVRGYRTCKTKRDWDRDRDLVRANNSGGSNACATPGIARGC